MQKYRFIQYLSILLIFLSGLAVAQPNRWFRMYSENKIGELAQLKRAGKISQPDWAQFIDALYVEETDSALKVYIKIYTATSDENLKKITLDRISQFYYAKGFYESANRILEDEQFRRQVFAIREKANFFGVQLGAFSSYGNALQAKKKFQKKISNVFILSKTNRGKTLYVVVAGKVTSRAAALKLRKEILSRTGHKGLIVSFEGE